MKLWVKIQMKSMSKFIVRKAKYHSREKIKTAQTDVVCDEKLYL